MKSLNYVWQRVLWTLLVLVASCANKEPTPPEVSRPKPAPRQALVFKEVKETMGAMREATLFVEQLPSAGASLEIRTITVSQPQEVVFSPEHEVALELRGGRLLTMFDGRKTELQPGDTWLVSRGARVAFKVQGELAVLRAIYLVPEKPQQRQK